MAQTDHFLGLYLHLARAAEQRNRLWVRDKFLLLAGAVAAQAGLADVATECRHRVLAHNPQHLVGHHGSIEEGLADERFQSFLNQLRRRYNQERCEHILRSLGISLAREREAYYSDGEYGMALLAPSPEPHASGGAHQSSSAAGARANPYGPRESNAQSPPNKPASSLNPFQGVSASLTVLLLFAVPLAIGLLAAIALAWARFLR